MRSLFFSLFTCLLFITGILSACNCNASPKQTESKTDPLPLGLKASDAKKVLAKVGTKEITMLDFARELERQTYFQKNRMQTKAQQQMLLQEMIEEELWVQAAIADGYANKKEVKDVERQQLMLAYRRERVDALIPPDSITGSEISLFYQSHSAEFSQPEQRRISHILFDNRTKAERALKELLGKPKNDPLFRQWVERESKDLKSKERFGDIGFVSITGNELCPKEVSEAIFALDGIGQVVPKIIQTSFGFHVARYNQKREALARTLDDVEHIIRMRLLKEKRDAAWNAAVENLMQTQHVQTQFDALSQINLDLLLGETPPTHPLGGPQ